MGRHSQAVIEEVKAALCAGRPPWLVEDEFGFSRPAVDSLLKNLRRAGVPIPSQRRRQAARALRPHEQRSIQLRERARRSVEAARAALQAVLEPTTLSAEERLEIYQRVNRAACRRWHSV